MIVRWSVVGVVLSLGVSSAALATTPGLDGWAAALHVSSNWHYVTGTDVVRVFLAPTTPPSANSMWERIEFQTPQTQTDGVYLSSVSLLEFDCRQTRVRVLQSTNYAERDLHGTTTNFPLPQDWEVPRVNTLLADELQVGCASQPPPIPPPPA